MDQNRFFIQYLRSKGFLNLELNESGLIETYGDSAIEAETLQSGTVCREISAKALIQLKGTDTLDFLHRISTNEVNGMLPRQMKYTLFVNEKGRLLDRTLLVYLQDSFLLIGNEERAKLLKFWLTRYIINDDVTVSGMNEEFSLFEFMGDQVLALMILVFGDAVKNLRPGVVVSTEFNHQECVLIPFTEKDGTLRIWLYGRSVPLINIINACMEGQTMVPFSFVGEKAYNSYRIAKGLPGVNEINDQYNPHELLFKDEISFSKGCYIGQEVIARLETYNKVQKYLRTFHFMENIPEDKELKLYNEENEEIGQITSSAKAPRSNMHIGLGFIRNTHASEGTEVFVRNGNDLGKVVVKIPGKS
ncbi:MAG: hypothetical protein LWX56_09045 [Ignavibacteria bacterium]|nr:hypothetical protein [Ignavibacteria bacterium]